MNQDFIHTGNDIKGLIGLLDEIRGDITTLYTSNHVIVDSISQLSGSTEEVSAVSEEGLQISNTILDKMKQFNERMEKIHNLVARLEEIVINNTSSK